MRSGIYLIVIAGLVLGNDAVDAEPRTIRVTKKMAFVPAEIGARLGDTIEWVNKDILFHTATVKGGWDVLIPANGAASLAVSETGQVEYKGRLSVAAP